VAGNERYLFPGVYTSEVPVGGEPLQPTGTSAAAFIGTAEWGPMGTPTLVTSWADFVRKFGNDRTNGYLARAALNFFRMGGMRLYVGRTCHYTDVSNPATLTAVKAAVTMVSDEIVPQDMLVFTAKYYGSFGNDLSVQILNVDGTNLVFDVAIIQTVDVGKSKVIEWYQDVSADSTSDDFIEDIINSGTRKSNYVTVAVSVEDVLPVAATTALTLGDDGLTSIADEDYIGDSAGRTGMYSLDTVREMLTICHPGITAQDVIVAGQNYVTTALSRRSIDVYAFDFPLGYTAAEVAAWKASHLSNTGYEWGWFPWVVEGSTEQPLAPYVCGAAARNDFLYGVWNAPAGTDFDLPITELDYDVSLGEGQILNPKGINVAIRLPDEGFVLWGARTFAVNTHFRYINVRRFTNAIKKTLQDGTLQFVFDLNAPSTWRRVEDTAHMLMMYYHSLGAFAGKTPEESFYVRCDATTNPPELVDQGIMTCVIGICPVKPAEFVEFEIQLFNTGDLPLAESPQA